MGETLSILVVEDNEDNQQIAQIILEREGYRVDLAATSAEVRQRISAHRPDLILMDVHLGLEDGLDVARGLKADPATAAIPIVALTALAASDDLTAAGCAGSISKPIDTRIFPAQVRGYLCLDRHVNRS
ncbi:MAG TPA: response regulator [Candidatus Eisenbacteria bacterium]|nr:response regulator [Candidatus Eisenbacteria bacterium]